MNGHGEALSKTGRATYAATLLSDIGTQQGLLREGRLEDLPFQPRRKGIIIQIRREGSFPCGQENLLSRQWRRGKAEEAARVLSGRGSLSSEWIGGKAGRRGGSRSRGSSLPKGSDRKGEHHRVRGVEGGNQGDVSC